MAQTVHEAVSAVSEPSPPIASASAAQTDGGLAATASTADAAGLPAQEQGDAVLPSADAVCFYRPKPDYPPMSRLRHETGTVKVDVLIGTDGRVQKTRIEKTSGYVRLDDAAQATVYDSWRCRPYTRDGVPVAKWYGVPFEFNLE
ncbi:MAG: energy transducer TonB [Burkholderiaceae bacterium]|nr:energy transducer TonB [Burkholderiaceae bacterium]